MGRSGPSKRSRLSRAIGPAKKSQVKRNGLTQQKKCQIYVEWDEKPSDPVVLLEKHLLYRSEVDDKTEAIRNLCNRITTALFGNDWTPRSIEQLAQDLIPVLGDEVQEQAILTAFANGTYKQIAKWFADNTDVEHSTRMISSAALEGAKAVHIIDAARRLADRIRQLAMEGMVTEPRPIFAFPREEWLRTCRAHIVALMRLLLVDDVLKYILHQLKNQQKQEQMLEELLERAVGE